MPYDESFLNNPTLDVLRRRHLLPLARFTDDDIASMDYDSWKATASRYEWHPAERKKMEELIESIRWEGLRNKVEILRNDDEARVYWERAAAAGDRDAIDYLAILREEGES
ncbi:hypothetical protein PV336_16315 [Streptomyces sp. MI02-2A]|uniref:hypothetical protein n=1 Tax=Streptomyces sp. MI02-2A TaxID=3028688 RepID=UPI0029ADEE02|nr:hypothetical protein [Streptomyces sp. MI02-2A]MDX3260786.1 hypothetical protein [Streptomyces sp. MI02-2A]